MYHILFEHPLVEAATGWDFADGAWLGAPSGLIRKDNTLKPSYLELKRLIHEEWHTDERVVTDENGIATINGFKGEYELKVNGQNIKYVLDESSDELVRVVV